MAGSFQAHPLVSIVIPVRDRAGPLRSTLESLCGQTLSRETFEVVVVDDGSTDGSVEVARAFEGRLPIRWTSQRSAGVASARNHGLFFARGVIVLFLEDELAEPDLLERHVEAHRRFPEERFAVLGRARLDPAVEGDPLTRFASELPGLPGWNPPGRSGEPLDWSTFAAGRSSCKRGFLLQRGIFDARFRLGGDGAELACRLTPRGFQVVYEPDGVTRVARRTGVDGLCAVLRRDGAARRRLADLHEGPEVEEWLCAAAAADLWRAVGGCYEPAVRAARELDRIAAQRERAGLPTSPRDTELFRSSWRLAFDASRAKGIVDGPEDETVPRGPA